MTTLEPQITELITAYRTCEFTTLATDGTPLTWPISPFPQSDGSLLVTTSLGFPQKAFNVRRDGRVGLLFSDPTASGLVDPPHVFVGGTATCPDEIVTTPKGREDYWRMLFERQPSSTAYLRPPANWLMDWYYMRLLITVTPSVVDVRDAPKPAGPEPTNPGLLGAARLAEFPDAVLGARDADGAPLLTRTHPVPTEAGFAVAVPDGVAVTAGPASLLAHRHDENLSKLTNLLVRGELRRDADGWVLVPERIVEPAPTKTPADFVRLLRNTRGSARAYLGRRGLERPRVPWAEYRAIAAGHSVPSASPDSV